MAKLKTDLISPADLLQFVESQSDFAFELRTLEWLNANGFICEHGGSYNDPATGKPRQFDIRAVRFNGEGVLHLAVECKNVSAHSPLLISCVPRIEREAYHDVAFGFRPIVLAERQPDLLGTLHSSEARAGVVRASRGNSIYRVNEPVGKSCDQVGRTTGNDLVGSDAEVYEKWSQALSSSRDLIKTALSDGLRAETGYSMSLVVPCVVVPDDRLWTVVYETSGKRKSDPVPVERCSFYVDQHHDPYSEHKFKFSVSHLEFVTLSGLAKLVDSILGNDRRANVSFASRQVLSRIKAGA